jgi:hypothetical protein
MSTRALYHALDRLLLLRVPSRAPSAIVRTQLLLQSHRRLACRHLPFISTTRRCLATSSSAVPLENIPIKNDASITPQACPACGQKCFRPLVLQRHLQRCCPDLLLGVDEDPKVDELDFTNMDEKTLEIWLANAREKELEKQERAVRNLETAFQNQCLFFLSVFIF